MIAGSGPGIFAHQNLVTLKNFDLSVTSQKIGMIKKFGLHEDSAGLE